MSRVASILVASLLSGAALAHGDELPMSDVGPHHDASGRYLETVAVGLPDASLPTFESRCRSARDRAEARATEALLSHVDSALERVSATPPTVARVREVVTSRREIRSRRPLVDCGMVVSMRVSLAELDAAAPGLGVSF